ncbi:MAG: aminodeoxychorismate/anthranilate synthase component II [Candidatus Margulisbacteria bacterium]|nr:aminodeoxychorismate/anthranilate synthase component II [Candidatus Margulisiibacteriota bacterium]
MLLMIDNFDSFTYNLVQYLGELGAVIEVYRNNDITPDEVEKMAPKGIVISPGPGRPQNAGNTKDIIQAHYQSIPILGICLGHQAIAEVFGGDIVHAPYLMHGKASEICHDGKTVFKDIPSPFIATRYHSLVVDPASLPDCLEKSAWTTDDIIMGVRHKTYPVEGIQFHPESILTLQGKAILKNFLAQISQ